MYTIEEVKKYYEGMALVIKKVTQGEPVKDADEVFNAIDEVQLLKAENVIDERHGEVNKVFLIGRVSEEREDGLFDFEPTLTVQTRDAEGGLIAEIDYCPASLKEEEALNGCFLPFLTELKKYV